MTVHTILAYRLYLLRKRLELLHILSLQIACSYYKTAQTVCTNDLGTSTVLITGTARVTVHTFFANRLYLLQDGSNDCTNDLGTSTLLIRGWLK